MLKLNRWQLWKWAMAHDMKPKHLLYRMFSILKTRSRILLVCFTVGIESIVKLATLPLEPFRVAIMATWHVLVSTDKVRAMHDSLSGKK